MGYLEPIAQSNREQTSPTISKLRTKLEASSTIHQLPCTGQPEALVASVSIVVYSFQFPMLTLKMITLSLLVIGTPKVTPHLSNIWIAVAPLLDPTVSSSMERLQR
uniref:Uncharacterized protein n=1 Tax=Cucumis melo TaxID=3656 RepID=A0A9I9CD23_CUCME